MERKKTKVAISWSGGKDGCLALYRILKEEKEVVCLVSMVSELDDRNHAHGIRLEIVKKQAKALGIPLVLVDSGNDYEKALVNALIELKNEKGIEEIAFGSLYSEEDKMWNVQVASRAGVTPIFPVWISKDEANQLLSAFISLGFSSVICRASETIFDQSWAGRFLDWTFYNEIQRQDSCPMGELGEYHTFVLDGPIFKNKIQLVKSGVVLNSGLWSLDIEDCQLLEKKSEIDLVNHFVNR
ncbi:diphthine--ammonia ligase [Bacillus sp. BHET2]|uniref:Dph6-related ATP pyrophosphatase n=1 Tax=Bacillus sp. BHET2 TaxID=2583818 RepID=UPI00110EED95|nr:diphthine--ammonia ligase [Bacillus sp. BHET2]TMU85735.1 diphthine--ammonia ligase [Bacillus sp. BHET2]